MNVGKVTLSPLTKLDIRRKRDMDGCILSLPDFEIGISPTESKRIGTQFIQAANIQSAQFPDSMYGCGLYDTDSADATRVVAMIHVGRINADKFIITVWTDVDKQTRMFGTTKTKLLSWVDILYDVKRDAEGRIISNE